MTDKEIIKALECCKKPAGTGACKNCPLDKDRPCTTTMMESALDLINRQQAEIERLEKLAKDRADVNFEKIVGVVDRASADIKSEAIKEFAERLDRKFAFYYSDTQCISAKTIRESIRNELKETEGDAE